MTEDVGRAIDELRRRAKITRVSLLGIRFGAAIASAVAARRNDIDSLVLWAPMLKPWDYLYDGLHQTIAMQSLLFRDIKFVRDDIVANVLAGCLRSRGPDLRDPSPRGRCEVV
jgi:pimeloyl-ACP methyl ester carboxylesterase